MASDRGLRNNNPFNLEDEGIGWQGMTGKDGPYCIFDTDENGIRAGMIDLLNAQKIHHRTTIAEIITPFAPPAENDTRAYIADVAGRLGESVDGSTLIDLFDSTELVMFSQAVITHENGQCPYDIDLLSSVAILAIAHVGRPV